MSMLYLTGPPVLNGFTLPRPSLNAGMEMEWDNEAVVKNMADGSVKQGPARWRGRCRFGYRGLATDIADAIMLQLLASEINFKPRTKAATDPASATEYEFNCRLLSELPHVADVSASLVTLTVELETVDTYSTIPGMG